MKQLMHLKQHSKGNFNLLWSECIFIKSRWKDPEANHKEAVMLDPHGGASPGGHDESRVSCTLAGAAHMTSDCFHLFCFVGLNFCLPVMCLWSAHCFFLRKSWANNDRYKTKRTLLFD